ncbi:MAG: hypothetical protein J5698_04420 [Bacteroidaceae bacterium]|nr:hypothetical protein [Bacteroidaceae bacterium]
MARFYSKSGLLIGPSGIGKTPFFPDKPTHFLSKALALALSFFDEKGEKKTAAYNP